MAKRPEDRAHGSDASANEVDGSSGIGGNEDSGVSGHSGMSGTGIGGTAGSNTAGTAGEAGGAGTAGNSGSSGGDSGSDDGDAEIDEVVPDSGDAQVDPVTSAVNGTVIDYYRNPVPATPVTLNGVTVMTNEDGELTFEDVAATYSVSVSIDVARFGATAWAGYLFVDLTRRDPTLQVLQGLPRRTGNVTRTVQNVTFPLPSNDELQMDYAGQYGGFYDELDSYEVTSSGDWDGPATTQAPHTRCASPTARAHRPCPSAITRTTRRRSRSMTR